MPTPTLEDRVAACRAHLDRSVVWKGERLGILEMRRHYKNYFKGISHVKEVRLKLQTEDRLEQLHEILNEISEVLLRSEDLKSNLM